MLHFLLASCSSLNFDYISVNWRTFCCCDRGITLSPSLTWHRGRQLHYAVWFKEHFAHSVALSHFKQNTLRNILPPASSHSWSWLACCAPVSLSSPSVCRAAVGVNGNKCQSLTISGTLFSPALICCSDLLFRFSPSPHLTALTLFFTSWAMNNKLLDAALWYTKQMWSHKAQF